MKLITAFLQLVRWPNLLFIMLTQLLFEYCIYERIYGAAEGLSQYQFWYIIIASVFIAAAGNIINDYFDLNIDQVNKPDKVVVNVVINRRWVIFWHMLLSMLGLFFTVVALPVSLYWHLVLANIGSVLLLWFYSTNFKKQLLVGNIVISLLTAWVILILFFAKQPLQIEHLLSAGHNEIRFFRLAMLYASFAFVISLIREVVKDVEDMEGDRKYGCKTLPIVWGVQAAKIFVAVWLVVLIAALTILQLYVLPLGWWHSALYCLIAIIVPLIWIFIQLFKASTPADFHRLSSVIKLVMLTGILSMVFFRIYE
ncbi:geranylgeranylglycerol-phosphate geranylgeranyltransferase [Sediminibacterium sp.]|uniref:geranylgeranylglycerol-phosphate geranylgeranyltransferase n=1 Tax=Sediminibacterium sp. TaxID=1917865 RepID=UPI0025DD2864|nr:geranylgeranylglycerol-phosphate geranylgeranyltransferase [Sediminibacterium sp.]MBW0178061.1 geranylgeranylglycerol-phosphate geranylgeranyltransferase [Sediminibacterium sp.]